MLNLPALAMLLAVFVLASIPLMLLAWLGRLRVPLVMEGKIAASEIALDRDAWPEQAKKVSNAFDNQFQLPVLFYLAAIMMLFLGVGWLEIVLSWVFVASRIVHAVIHVTSNHVFRRFVAFAAGYAALVALWLVMLMRWLLVAL